ncbi:hypothetical protein GS501_07950 [Saccharibacter sp. 17.LH.SD]|uniref:hypothetical protein n=1 Tax=Saccharibacter sp. 17.LH.SD TaxID=2689393 RepID=UPI001370B1CB|nr:hypothetical protein [Saccharibacter sp. 17.LH.SD]MXV44970.1 hypothetical protein [Saccharibacter sp. 17.LH.SD]
MRTIFFLTVLVLLANLPSIGRADSAHPVPTTPMSSKDLVITSDSNAYCQQLDQALSEKIRLPHSIPVGVMEDARLLQKRGEILCGHHHVRAGIERLRRALLLLKKHEGSLQ